MGSCFLLEIIIVSSRLLCERVQYLDMFFCICKRSEVADVLPGLCLVVVSLNGCSLQNQAVVTISSLRLRDGLGIVIFYLALV